MKKFRCPKCGGVAYEVDAGMNGDTTINYELRCLKCGAIACTQISPYDPHADEKHKRFYEGWIQEGEEDD